MGKLTEHEQTPEEKAQEEQSIAHRKAEATAAILSSLDLDKDRTPEEQKADLDAQKKENDRLLETPEEKLTPEERSKRVVLEKKLESEKPELTEEELLQIPDDDLTEEGLKIKKELQAKKGKSGDEDEDEEGGELIPKSKVDKRFKSLTSEIKDLREKLEKATADSDKAKDPDMVKLEGKSITELRSFKNIIKKKILKEADDDKVDDYIELESKIDECILTAPQRFHDRQLVLYNATVKQIVDDEGIDPKGEEAQEIKKIAVNIYQTYDKLQGMEDGMAMALKFAIDHYKIISKNADSKNSERNLKSKLSNLKKRTMLDSNLLKRDKKSGHLARLRDNARGDGTMLAKQAYIKEAPEFNIDDLIPEEFKGR
jgi:hypothetical protein